jgi:hypothetical protein
VLRKERAQSPKEVCKKRRVSRHFKRSQAGQVFAELVVAQADRARGARRLWQAGACNPRQTTALGTQTGVQKGCECLYERGASHWQKEPKRDR